MTCSCILLLSVRWSQSFHTLSGAKQFGMWVAMQGDSGPITHNTMLLTLRVSMSSHRPVRSLPLCKCPINFLCKQRQATESDNGNLPKHVAITCDIPAYHNKCSHFLKLSSDDKICCCLLFIKHFSIDGSLIKCLVFVQVRHVVGLCR